MASLPFIVILLSLLLVAPQLSGVEESETITKITLFGLPTLAMTIDGVNQIYWGPVLHNIQNGLGLSLWDVVPPKMVTRPILGPQPPEGDRPPGLFQLTVKGRNGAIAKLVFRIDNLYCAGFANRFEQYFVLRGQEHVMPGARKLQIGHDYPSLLGKGGLRVNLRDLPLGKDPWLDGASIFDYHPYNNVDDRQLGRALATMLVMVPESLRIIPVHDMVTEIWASGDVGYLVNDPYNNYDEFMLNWESMSALVLCTSRGQPLRGKRLTKLTDIHLTEQQRVLEILNVMLRPRTFHEYNMFQSCGDPPRRRSGRPDRLP